MKNKISTQNNLIKCRFCKTTLKHTFVDLGMSPVANDNVTPKREQALEPFYPLHVFVCEKCFLVQLPAHKQEHEIFTDDYAYFSSFSTSWLVHAKTYVDSMMSRFNYTNDSFVVELASNDGYLLQYFKEYGIPHLGIEPCGNVADAAIEKGIPTIKEFFGNDTAGKVLKAHKKADLIIGNNVFAHVPDINDFAAGCKTLLKDTGIVTMEFQHLIKLMQKNEFDTIYHEHYTYYSFYAVEQVMAKQGLTIFDLDEIPTHGGSLRIYCRHAENTAFPVSRKVMDLRNYELSLGINTLNFYKDFENKVEDTKRKLLSLLIQFKKEGKTIIGYGAPAKGNTLLNYCGIRTDFLDYTVDRSPQKQGKFLPGTHIPIHAPEKIKETKPDYVLILPWNLLQEVTQQLHYIREWGGKFIIPIPEPRILD